jgi:hypothetical protein
MVYQNDYDKDGVPYATEISDSTRDPTIATLTSDYDGDSISDVYEYGIWTDNAFVVERFLDQPSKLTATKSTMRDTDSDGVPDSYERGYITRAGIDLATDSAFFTPVQSDIGNLKTMKKGADNLVDFANRVAVSFDGPLLRTWAYDKVYHETMNLLNPFDSWDDWATFALDLASVLLPPPLDLLAEGLSAALDMYGQKTFVDAWKNYHVTTWNGDANWISSHLDPPPEYSGVAAMLISGDSNTGWSTWTHKIGTASWSTTTGKITYGDADHELQGLCSREAKVLSYLAKITTSSTDLDYNGDGRVDFMDVVYLEGRVEPIVSQQVQSPSWHWRYAGEQYEYIIRSDGSAKSGTLNFVWGLTEPEKLALEFADFLNYYWGAKDVNLYSTTSVKVKDIAIDLMTQTFAVYKMIGLIQEMNSALLSWD